MADLMMFDVSMGGEVSFLESEYYLADNIFDFYIRLGDGHFDRRKAVS
ncbi:MAG: hypothetical protein QOH47_2290 [Sphingomonadales bacterium]|nr:hypothetical protein [Sphingomonadales bacterium]